MTFKDDGINEIHKLALRNESGVTPDYYYFAGSDNTYTGSESSISNEFIRKLIIWQQTGNNSAFIVQLSSVEAIGSTINSNGFVSGSATGSGILFTGEPSFIGAKTNNFNVQIEGEVHIRRPR